MTTVIIIIIIITIIRRQFLTCRNTTEVITRARINTEADDLSHSLDTYQLGAVSGEEVRLQRDFKTVNRLLGTNVLQQSVPLRRGSDAVVAGRGARGGIRPRRHFPGGGILRGENIEF